MQLTSNSWLLLDKIHCCDKHWFYVNFKLFLLHVVHASLVRPTEGKPNTYAHKDVIDFCRVFHKFLNLAIKPRIFYSYLELFLLWYLFLFIRNHLFELHILRKCCFKQFCRSEIASKWHLEEIEFLYSQKFF